MLRVCLWFALVATGCGSRQNIREFSQIPVTFPNGESIRVEPLSNPVDMARGAMFRDSMAKDRGLLYQYAKPGYYTYWMFQTKMPLDTIWVGSDRRVVEVVPNMPPCPAKSTKDCPRYGGHAAAMFVIQIPAGMAKVYGVELGSRLTF
jgi:uncharacterized membrane protein (UPF0127 family)